MNSNDFEQMDFVERSTLGCAGMFLTGWQDWNEYEVLKMACDWHGYDYDFCYLAGLVLFGPAVVHLTTGKSV